MEATATDHQGHHEPGRHDQPGHRGTDQLSRVPDTGRAFYLDLAQWAVEEPGRWGPWVASCPVGKEELDRRKATRQRKSRMDARTGKLLPALPALVRSINTRRAAANTVLSTARGTEPGQTFTAGGTSLIRSTVARGAGDLVWPEDPATGKRRNLGREEDRAFWAWAVVGSCAARLRPPALW